MQHFFKGGIRPDFNKNLTENLSISIMPPPAFVYIPVTRHSGKEAVVAVKEGQRVKKGELIASVAEELSCNIYSSVSGTVKSIAERPSVTDKKILRVEIENDFREDEISLPKIEPVNFTPETLINRIKEAGIAEISGSGSTLVINGVECEPYITCGYRIMLEYAKELLAGINCLKIALGAKTVFLGVEENKKEAVKALLNRPEAVLADKRGKKYEDKIQIVPIKPKYPQDAEKQLIHSLTKHKILEKNFPGGAGACVFNVHTALSAYFAVYEGKPVFQRVITVSGKGAAYPCNAWIKNGMLYMDIAKEAGVLEAARVLSFESEAGLSASDLETAASKTTDGVLFLTEDEIKKLRIEN